MVAVRSSLFFVLLAVAAITSGGAAGILGGASTAVPHTGSIAGSVSGSGSTTYRITFLETGLAPGTTWSASITNSTDINILGQGNTISSSTDTLTFYAAPGSYSAVFFAEGPYVMLGAYGFSVGSQSYTLKVPFIDEFPVTVTGTGVPQNVSLGISLSGSFRDNALNGYNGPSISGFDNSETELAVNGTYKVMFGETLSNGADLFGYVDNCTVNGSGVSLNVSFHSVFLSASGIPDNVSWGFQRPSYPGFPTGGLYPGSPRNVTVYLPTGSTFLEPVAEGYYNPGFFVNITSGNASRAVVFEKEYAVNFTSNSLILPPGSMWGISGLPFTLEDSPYVATNLADQSYYVPNGSYSTSVWISLPGDIVEINGSEYYISVSHNLSKSNITVNGQSQAIEVRFNITYTPVESPIAAIAPYLTTGIIIAVSAIAGTVYILRKRKE